MIEYLYSQVHGRNAFNWTGINEYQFRLKRWKNHNDSELAAATMLEF